MNNLAPMRNCPGGLQGNLNWMPGYNLRVTFQSHIRFARKVQKYGDAFSKSSSIYIVYIIYKTQYHIYIY